MDRGEIDRRAFIFTGAAAGAGLAVPGLAGAKGKRISRGIPRHLQQAMRGHVFERGAPGYSDARKLYNERFDWVMPQAVARPVDERDVQSAVRWAVARGVSLRARSGGHSYEGYSSVPGGVMLDMRKLSGIAVNHHQRTATVGAGAQLIDVYAALAHRGVTIPGGSCPSVGIAGVTLGGGQGLAGRAFGLTADNVLGAHVVTVDGRLRHVNAKTDPDLLWALRGGGGGNFGVVTQFTFRIHALPRHTSYFFVSWPWSSASEALDAWQHWAPHVREEMTPLFHLSAGGGTSVGASGQYLGPQADVNSLIAPLRSVPGAQVRIGEKSYLDMQMTWAGCSNLTFAECHTVGSASGGTLARASFQAKSDFVRRPLSSQARGVLTSAIESRATQPGSGAILFDAYGGALNRVHPNATAFVHRDQLFCIQYITYDGGSSWIGRTHGSMRSHVSGQAYQNYIDRDLPHWQRAYYGKNYSRLESIRKSVDPHHFFNFPQAIGR
jgi:FAD/FMN-containing dehydrogenase